MHCAHPIFQHKDIVYLLCEKLIANEPVERAVPTLLSLGKVCKVWHRASNNYQLWQQMYDLSRPGRIYTEITDESVHHTWNRCQAYQLYSNSTRSKKHTARERRWTKLQCKNKNHYYHSTLATKIKPIKRKPLNPKAAAISNLVSKYLQIDKAATKHCIKLVASRIAQNKYEDDEQKKTLKHANHMLKLRKFAKKKMQEFQELERKARQIGQKTPTKMVTKKEKPTIQFDKTTFDDFWNVVSNAANKTTNLPNKK